MWTTTVTKYLLCENLNELTFITDIIIKLIMNKNKKKFIYVKYLNRAKKKGVKVFNIKI